MPLCTARFWNFRHTPVQVTIVLPVFPSPPQSSSYHSHRALAAVSNLGLHEWGL